MSLEIYGISFNPIIERRSPHLLFQKAIPSMILSLRISSGNFAKKTRDRSSSKKNSLSLSNSCESDSLEIENCEIIEYRFEKVSVINSDLKLEFTMECTYIIKYVVVSVTIMM